ncbi:hypothetical protein SteCoe_36842 [Stentor coeruleus]|uniref:B box-type domain-containing protein n=1 Tax=Stentor coeruleus TaxID=5963 RepID=A0A1R2APH0_9CILI|nr:hypothetical protein SteCoe_36842 [Stentor coeruleus]
MDCIKCSAPAFFECKCSSCGLCQNCAVAHVMSDNSIHVLLEISLFNSISKCDSCKINYAKVSCLCQDDKKRFCSDCIRIHLEKNSSHCVEPIGSQMPQREILKYQEKRRKIEYLSFEVKKNLEALKECREKVKVYRQNLIKNLENSTLEAQSQAGKCKNQLKSLYFELQTSISHSENEGSLADNLINSTDPEALEKGLNLVDAKLQTESTAKSIMSACKFISNKS